MATCSCRHRYCCDNCWAETAKADPCPAPRCKNPYGHAGPHGALANTQVINILAADLLPKEALDGDVY